MNRGDLNLVLRLRADGTAQVVGAAEQVSKAVDRMGESGSRAARTLNQSSVGPALVTQAGEATKAVDTLAKSHKELAKNHLEAGRAVEVSAGQMAMGRQIAISNLVNIGNVAVATKGDLVSMASPLPDLVYGLRMMGVGFSGTVAAALGAGAAVAALAAPFAVGALRAAEMASQLKTLRNGLRAVGREGEFQAVSLRRTAFDLAGGQGDVGRDDAVAGISILAGSRTLRAGQMAGAAEAARDLAAALGRDLPEAADVLVKALDGGEAGLRKLNDQLRFADAAEMEHIHGLTMHGRAGEAAAEAIGLLRRQIGGLAEQEMGAFAKAWRDVKNAASDAADVLSRPWREITLGERIADARKELEQARADLRPGMGSTGGLNRLQSEPFGHDRADRARRALAALESAARNEAADLAAANADMMPQDAATRFSATEYARAKREREDRARILAITNPAARRRAEAEFEARRDGAARGIGGGYLDLYAAQGGKGAVDGETASARDATTGVRLQAEAQERLAKAAGVSSEAQRQAAVANKIAEFSY
ncbi:MAG: phage tail length tape measure family protein, partial [Alphaproteobacteria bacterium]|nr:phage tail length tape measure family protein [Alphaproteobacteria bacterium]